MRRSLLLVLANLSFALVAACSGTVNTGGGSETSNTSGSGGGSESSSGATTSSSSGAGGGGGGCSGSISLVMDNGAPQVFSSACAGMWNPPMEKSAIGYIVSGGPAPGIENLILGGCATPAENSEGLSFSVTKATSPGVYTDGLTQYIDPNGSPWGFAGNPFELTVDKLGDTGDSIDGSFKVIVTHVPNGNAAHTITGTFHVCRVLDELVP